MHGELLHQRNANDIKDALKKSLKIAQRENGNRHKMPKVWLNYLKKKIVHKIGLSRLADISQLSIFNFPTYQSTRPILHSHTKMGQNSGAQGKGRTKTQAQISCLMESIEVFSMEPRNMNLVKASYKFLKNSRPTINPQLFHLSSSKKFPKLNEEIMWTPAYSANLQNTVWIPAETVYFPFNAEKFQTRHFFCQGSNGLASGSHYLEACIHALYELIERHYTAYQLSNCSELEAIFEHDFDITDVQSKVDLNLETFQLQLFNIRIPKLGKQNIPNVFACLVGKKHCFMGWGCNFSVDVAVSRAASEALQAYATFISGSREDLGSPFHQKQWNCIIPKSRTLTRELFVQKTSHKIFSNLKTEYDFLINWLKSQGFSEVYFANLTRVGIDVPVVKAIVPGLKIPDFARKVYNWRPEQPESFQFGGLQNEN